MAVQATTLHMGILLNTLNAPLSTRLLPTNTFDSKPLWAICSWTQLPFSSAMTLAHAFKLPTKVTAPGSIPSCCIFLDNDNAFCPCPHFTSPSIREFNAATSHTGILLKALHASSMLPHFVYMMRLLPTWTSDSQPLWRICVWMHLPSSSAHELACAVSTETNVNWSGILPSFCSFWKSSIVLLCSPAFVLLVSLVFQEKMFNCTVPRAMATSPFSTHEGFCWAIMPPFSFYVWSRDTLHSPMFSAGQPYIPGSLLQTKSQNPYIIIVSIFFLFTFAYLWSHNCEGSEKNSRRSLSTKLFRPTKKPQKLVKKTRKKISNSFRIIDRFIHGFPHHTIHSRRRKQKAYITRAYDSREMSPILLPSFRSIALLRE